MKFSRGAYAAAQGRVHRALPPPVVNRIHDLQKLSLTYAQISLEKTCTQHRLLTDCLLLYFPEIERDYHAFRSERLLELLRGFPAPALISCLSMQEFGERPSPS
jgi:hypothetical protein